MIRLQLLGPLDLRRDGGREIQAVLAQPKRTGILAYLAAATPAGTHRRDTLLGLFWPELDQEHARNALNQAVHFLRRTLGEGAILSRSAEDLALDDTAVWVDVRAFSAALDQDRVDEALALYRGDLLPSFFLPETPAFEEWLERERAHLRSRAAVAARVLGERHEAANHLTLAVTSARRAVELSNGDERSLRRLIELLERSGDRAAAVRVYEEFARRMAAEFDIEPDAETLALIQRIRTSPLPRPAPKLEPPPAAWGPPVSRIAAALTDRYQVEGELGAGAMAVVALARDLRHHRRVAIKILRPELSSQMGPQRFLREIDIAADLMHPHILPLHDSGEADGLLYYVMPYVEGESLRGRLERERRLPVEDALRVAREVADALAYAHRRGFVHRDIKPENILLSGGHALVADFGIARAIGSATDGASSKTLGTGTPAYMSPEQVSGEGPVDARTDIYALGCVLYEMLSGEPPFAGRNVEETIVRRLNGGAPPALAVPGEIGPQLDTLLAKALARAPEQRLARAEDFMQALSPKVFTASVPRARSGKWRVPAALAALAVLLAVSLLAWARVRGQGRRAADPQVLAVLPFRVAGADPSLKYLQQGMVDMLVTKLTGEGGPRAADVRSVLAAVRSVAGTPLADLPERDALNVAERLGAGLVLQGSVVGPPEHLVIAASLTGAGIAPKHATVEGSKDSLFALVDRLAATLLALRAGVGAQQLSSLMTTSLEALRAYLDGQAAYRRGAFAEAIRRLDRAVELDSTFALAASALVEADSWGEYKRADEVARLAWRYRGRLSDRDRILLSVRLGSRYPLWTSASLELSSAERFTQITPESPEAWYKLGDVLFHDGLLVPVLDARQRAGAMFRRALDRDSLFAPALSHLVGLAAEQGDSGALEQLVPRLLALDSSDVTAWGPRWYLASARHDERTLDRMTAALDSLSPIMVLHHAEDHLGDSTGLAYLAAFLAVAKVHAATTEERAEYAWLSWVHATNRGRPTEAHTWTDSAAYPDISQRRGALVRRLIPILGWLQGGNTVGLDKAGRREERLTADPSAAPAWPSALFLTQASRLVRGDVASVNQTVRRFRTDEALADSAGQTHLVIAQILQAWAAVIRRSPQARQLLDSADSTLVGRGGFLMAEWFNPLVAHLYARLGAPDRALAAIRRRHYGGTFPHPEGLAERSRLEALWAAQTGDNRGAILAYRRFLMFRTSPEPSKVAQRDSVLTELAQLEGAHPHLVSGPAIRARLLTTVR